MGQGGGGRHSSRAPGVARCAVPSPSVLTCRGGCRCPLRCAPAAHSRAPGCRWMQTAWACSSQQTCREGAKGGAAAWGAGQRAGGASTGAAPPCCLVRKRKQDLAQRPPTHRCTCVGRLLPAMQVWALPFPHGSPCTAPPPPPHPGALTSPPSPCSPRCERCQTCRCPAAAPARTCP